MKMDRNVNPDGMGKYALLKLRPYRELVDHSPKAAEEVKAAISLLEQAGILDPGLVNTEAEFFVIRLKDRYAYDAIEAYANAAHADGNREWADECFEMLERAGRNSPWCKRPD